MHSLQACTWEAIINHNRVQAHGISISVFIKYKLFPPSLSPPSPSQVVCLARMMVYFGFYNFSKLLVLAKVLLDGLDMKSATSPTSTVGGLFMGKHQSRIL